MAGMSRRRFLKRSFAASAAAAIGRTKSSGRILGANEVIRVGVAVSENNLSSGPFHGVGFIQAA
jgi:hypothetical protein